MHITEYKISSQFSGSLIVSNRDHDVFINEG
jgi:hypothetical protein